MNLLRLSLYFTIWLQIKVNLSKSQFYSVVWIFDIIYLTSNSRVIICTFYYETG